MNSQMPCLAVSSDTRRTVSGAEALRSCSPRLLSHRHSTAKKRGGAGVGENRKPPQGPPADRFHQKRRRGGDNQRAGEVVALRRPDLDKKKINPPVREIDQHRLAWF